MDAKNEARANSLAIELASLVKGNENFLPPEVFNLIVQLVPIACVDMFPCRFYEGRWQMGFITRGTGFFRGKLWDIGGRINIGEPILDAFRRHMKIDMNVEVKFLPGVDWFKPPFVLQYYHVPGKPGEPPFLPDFGHEPSKHSIALTYPVLLGDGEMSFGSTAHGGQEVSDFQWFDVDNLPPKDDVAYGGYETTVLRIAGYLKEKFPDGI
ncbi:hypothetical protein D4R51_01390 [bacterium]|nr:MAG: hypothetical protein D4R51_01390 [bacterium]